MKFFIASLFLICTLSATAHASQQQMRDMSLSVEETIREPDNTVQKTKRSNNSGTGFDDSVEIDPNIANQLRSLNQQSRERDLDSTINNRDINSRELPGMRSNDLPEVRGSQGFMANFCSANYSAKTRADSTTQTCQESQRQQSCERFRHATIDVQRLLDRAINCEYIASGGEQSASDCDGLDAGRLDLLKQYWQDEESSYTILFLPDMVLNSAGNCSKTSTRKTGIK